MLVEKRNGSTEEFSFDKLSARIRSAGDGLEIPYALLVESVGDQIYSGLSTTELDELIAQQCAAKCTSHIDYGTLAGRISVSMHQKRTPPTFYEAAAVLSPLLHTTTWSIIQRHREAFDQMVVNDRDFLIDYFGFKTLERAYLMKSNNVIVERPQYMWLRVAIGIHGDDLELVKETYDLMSQKFFTHATPTLFNAGTPNPQLSSCYLIAMEEDSIDGIYNTLQDCARISKYAGGIGLHIHNIRATDSIIRGNNGKSTGIVPMLKVFNYTARYVNQGGRRNGSFAIYLEPWHADIEDFVELKKNHGDEEMRARDLFYAMWMPDLFMERVEHDGDWSLFCPDQCPGLSDCYGSDFKELFERYESEGRASKTMKARELWCHILDSQMETGMPYLLYKDAANRKSNQQNLGMIKSSNLCCEIMEYSDATQTAVCNLASIALNMFVSPSDRLFNYDELHRVTKVVTRNLDKVIDVNFYPTTKTETSNRRNRPIGIGVQGLADTFALMDIAFHSEAAKTVNRQIFETIYHAALECSHELAASIGPYQTFTGSPASNGILQFDMWGVTPSERYDWSALKADIQRDGLRNSLLVAPMPTASTSQIFGNNECFEPFTSNIYSRRTIAGDFTVVNRHLMKELRDLGLWSEELKNNIILNRGSIQQIGGIPQHMKDKYKIVWEIPMRQLLDMSADRGAFVCQSQSLNLWIEDPDYKTLTSMHFYGWKKGLKTGIYYLRRKPKHQPQQFTIDPERTQECAMCSA